VFASERTFEVQMANGASYHGVTPRHFCWNQQGELICEDEETDDALGKIAARLVRDIDAEQLAVEVPDGTVLAVLRSTVSDRPTEIRPPMNPLGMFHVSGPKGIKGEDHAWCLAHAKTMARHIFRGRKVHIIMDLLHNLSCHRPWR
jgi:hypothetical protein